MCLRQAPPATRCWSAWTAAPTGWPPTAPPPLPVGGTGWSGFLPGIAAEDTERRPTSSLVQEYWINMEGFPNPAEPIYDLRKGARDYWEIGGTLGLGLIEARVSIHPVDILDAVLGFFFIDIKGDDLTFENFK